jgi:hypothetical protein
LSEAYQAYTVYLFEVDETQYAIIDWAEGKESLDIEETRKNGQEDTHCRASIVKLPDGDQWSYVYQYENISDYTSDKHAANVLAYINTNPFYEDC